MGIISALCSPNQINLDSLFNKVPIHLFAECPCAIEYAQNGQWFDQNGIAIPPFPLTFDLGVPKAFRKVYTDSRTCNQCIYTLTVVCGNMRTGNGGFEITGIETSKKSPEFVKVVPNPANSLFRINATNFESEIIDLVEVFSSTGQLVKVFENVNVNQDLNLGEALPGIYMVNVRISDASYKVRLILK